MPLRIYIAPQIGNGIRGDLDPITGFYVWTDSTGPYRSLLHKFIDTTAGESFDEIDHPARHVSICTVEARAATLDAIDADSRIIAAIPIRATDRTHLAQILNAPFSSYPLAWRNAARNKLESWGVNTEWITGSHTMKDLLRHIIKQFSVAQVADGHGQSSVKEFLKANLNTQVSAIPADHRNAIRNWLQSKNIDISWITGSTTVREVIASLPASFSKLYGHDIKHHFAGEDL